LKWPGDSRVARLVEVDTPADPRRDFEFKEGVAVFEFSAMADDLQGYYWDFPSMVEGKPVMNRGVFDSRRHGGAPKADLTGVLRRALTRRGKDLDAYKLKGHPIRWYHRQNPISRPRVLLAGDAAGADALFGEGISLALGYGDVAAQAVADAFARQDFSFATYRQMLMDHWLMWQLPWRTRLARVAYLLRYPWLVRFGWRVAQVVIRFTRWRDPNFVPAEPPRLMVESRQGSG
jgi:flavin-dependent dehydrogenase